MKLNEELYRVVRYDADGKIRDYGILRGDEIYPILKPCRYDKELDMWFSRNAKYGISLENVN